MIGSGAGVSWRHPVALSFLLLAGFFGQAACAADCPGHPDAIGTSRTLVVDPRAHPRIGTMQYGETLPLEDHEVVLTFDDGPLPRNSNQILDILASECIKATFFEIGEMARAYPEGVRKLRDAGHTIGTHTQTHPLSMNRMATEQARQQIDDGIASVKAALGDDAALAPFFRIPGLLRAENVEDYLASQGIQTWSADFPADDWRPISSARVYDLAIKRIEAKGKGILLLHDIQARTVAALPRILHELKEQGFRIVHVVPASAENPATPTEPQQWLLHPTSEVVAISHWPKIRSFVFAGDTLLSAPAWPDMASSDTANSQMASRNMASPAEQLFPTPEPFDRRAHARGAPLPRASPWPAPSPLVKEMPATALTVALAVPAQSVFEIQENPHASMDTLAIFSHHADVSATEMERPAKPPSIKAGNASLVRHAKLHTRPERRTPLKRVVQLKKRNV